MFFRGVQLLFFILVNEWIQIQLHVESGDHRSASETMAFRWRADDGPTLNAGVVAL